MQKSQLFYIFLFLLFTSSTSFGADTLVVKRVAPNVKIGPKELELKDILDSVVLRKLQYNDYRNGRTLDAQTLKHYEDLITLRKLTANSLSAGKSKEWADSLESTLGMIDPDIRKADLLNALASYYAGRGDTGRAIKLFSDELKLAEAINNKFLIADITQKLAVLYNVNSNPQAAIKVLEYNIKTYLSLNCSTELADSYLALAENKTFQHRFEEAEYLILKKALPLFRKLSNTAGRMKCFSTLGAFYVIQGQLSQAKWFYIQANLTAGKLNDKDAKISSLISLAEVKKALGEHKSAIADFKAAELLARQRSNVLQLVKIKGSLGEIYHEVGNLSAAGTYIEEYNRLKANVSKIEEL